MVYLIKFQKSQQEVRIETNADPEMMEYVARLADKEDTVLTDVLKKVGYQYQSAEERVLKSKNGGYGIRIKPKVNHVIII